MLTGNKDTDRIILNKLDDKDLVNACQINKKAHKLCNDQSFWMDRTFQKFNFVSPEILIKYKGDRLWSDYYINDLRKINTKNQQELNDLLIDASGEGRLDSVIITLMKGADIHANNDFAVRLARLNGHLNVVEYLIEHGANINAMSNIHADNVYALRRSTQKAGPELIAYLKSYLNIK